MFFYVFIPDTLYSHSTVQVTITMHSTVTAKLINMCAWKGGNHISIILRSTITLMTYCINKPEENSTIIVVGRVSVAKQQILEWPGMMALQGGEDHASEMGS